MTTLDATFENARVLREMVEIIYDPATAEDIEIMDVRLRQFLKDPVIVNAARERYRTMYGNEDAPVCCGWCRLTRSPTSPLYRCREACFGGLPSCEHCVKVLHEQEPFHGLQKWVDNHWVNATLDDAGYIHQLGHGGQPCWTPDPVITVRAVSRPDGEHILLCRGCLCDSEDADEEVNGDGQDTVQN
ncbi:hypothetical protein FB45DRAFT_1017655 [Roridomyces roridus]|uniref:Uncharacterized protein n=1 Tax=Roridomyces roridus TaxID=1738132 RepID=A0AAD7FYQ5_9AGAR|nr:hypothetical protein FB45DRAFT_1017655 [Roridomyces roridus]